MNLFFHRLLFEYVTIFRSIRVPARWAMVCFVGLSLLAGLGGLRLVERLAAGRRHAFAAALGLVVALVLFEQRAAPLALVRGAADPDPLALRLKRTPMRGGIVELPSGVGHANYLYVLRSADHARPLVNGVSGFRPPVVRALEEMSRGPHWPDQLFCLLEAIPASYLVVHHSEFDPEAAAGARDFLARGVAAGRLRRVEGVGGDELFVVVRTEPDAAGGPHAGAE